MANLWLDLKGPILADTVYVDGVLAAKDVTIALPRCPGRSRRWRHPSPRSALTSACAASSS